MGVGRGKQETSCVETIGVHVKKRCCAACSLGEVGSIAVTQHHVCHQHTSPPSRSCNGVKASCDVNKAFTGCSLPRNPCCISALLLIPIIAFKTSHCCLFWCFLQPIIYEGQDKNPEMCRVLLTHEIMCRWGRVHQI